ncbi:unnamed protein product [Vicia faba]|uniref:Uncharacterized protein n=1 Tax=Vicia faba TaxID=3906 RepID=A0AAV0ZVL9_VICFA|nr:unnamed protein product [Vicia faba]
MALKDSLVTDSKLHQLYIDSCHLRSGSLTISQIFTRITFTFILKLHVHPHHPLIFIIFILTPNLSLHHSLYSLKINTPKHYCFITQHQHNPKQHQDAQQ